MISILFVEDDEVVMSNQRRVLSVMKRQWDMHFATNGEEALEVLAKRHYDVVVTDQSLPGLLGTELLGLIQYQYPTIVRVLMAGVTEADDAIAGAGIAHRLMRKPCDPRELSMIVERACDLETRLSDPDLQAIIGEIGSLPSPPAYVLELNDLIGRPDTTVNDVARCVETDIGMAAKLLQVVNSAYFSLSHHINDIGEAVSYLGLDTVRDLSVAMEMMRTFNDGPVLVQSAIDELQEHSLTVAHLAREIMTDRKRANEAFVAALLHDVGLLVIATRMPEKFLEMRVQTMRSNLPLTEVEMEVIGAHHSDIGAHLLDLWGLPYEIVEAVARHHDAADIVSDTMDPVHAVHIADAIISGQLQPGDAAWEHEDELDYEYLESLGVAEKVLGFTYDLEH